MAAIKFTDKTARPTKPKDINLIAALAIEMQRLRTETEKTVGRVISAQEKLEAQLTLNTLRRSTRASVTLTPNSESLLPAGLTDSRRRRLSLS